mgnify:CR=1 FL=1
MAKKFSSSQEDDFKLAVHVVGGPDAHPQGGAADALPLAGHPHPAALEAAGCAAAAASGGPSFRWRLKGAQLLLPLVAPLTAGG